MKCPACEKMLTTVATAAAKLDICKEGCVGIWFDAGELQRIDEMTELVPAEVLRPMKNRAVLFDLQKKRLCPVCRTSALSRVLHQKQDSFVIDECPQCHGYWLDLGELDRLRRENADNVQREKTLAAWLQNQKQRTDSTGDPRRLKAFLELLFR